MGNYVVTIARGFGSGGLSIGEALGTKLGIPCYEKEILTMASENSGINEAIFAQTDEKLRNSFFKRELGRIPHQHVLAPHDKNFVSDNNLYAIQKSIIEMMADTQSCIIIGKCANHVLRHRNHVLSVYVDAPRSACVKRILGKMSITEKEANRLIEKTDKWRADYYKYYTGGQDWVNPTQYHMFLNSDRLGIDGCVDIIEMVVRNRFIV